MDEIDINNLTVNQVALWVYLIKHKLTPSDAHSWAQDIVKIAPVADSWRKQTKRTDSDEHIRNMSTSILCMAVKQGLLHQSPDGLQAWDQSVSSCTSGKQLQELIRQGKVKTTQPATKDRHEGDDRREGKGPAKTAKAKAKATPTMPAAKGHKTSAGTLETAHTSKTNQPQEAIVSKDNGTGTAIISKATPSPPNTNSQEAATASAHSKNSGLNPKATHQSQSTQSTPDLVLEEESTKQSPGPAKSDTAGHTSPDHITGANDNTATTTPHAPQTTFEPDKNSPSSQPQPATATSSSKSQSGKQGPEPDLQRNLKEQGQLLMLLAAGRLDDGGNRRLQQLQAEFQVATKADPVQATPAGQKAGKP